MRRLVGVGLGAILFGLASLTGASAAPVQAEIAAKTVREDVYPKAPASFPGGIVGLPDVEYSNLIGYRPMLMDVYAHKDRAKARPLIIWIHGGGWSRGDGRGSGAIANFPAVLASLAARGYVVASVNYRLSGEARFPAAAQDVKASIRFLRAHAAEFGVDPSQVILWGGSAGGHLAALAATTCGLAALDPQPSNGRFPRRGSEAVAGAALPPVSDCVQGAVIWYGLLDLDKSSSVNLADFLGCDPAKCRDVVELANPVAHVGPTTPPMLLIHGLDDKTAPSFHSEALAARLSQAGRPVETLYIPRTDHGFLGETPEVTRDANLKALQRTFDYIEKIAPPKP